MNDPWKPPWLGLVFARCGGCTTSGIEGIRCCNSVMATYRERRYNLSLRWVFSSTLLMSSMWSFDRGGSDGSQRSALIGSRVELLCGLREPSTVQRLDSSSLALAMVSRLWTPCYVSLEKCPLSSSAKLFRGFFVSGSNH